MTLLTRRVALLMDAIEDDYQAGIVRGVLRASAQSGAQVRCIAGGVVGGASTDPRTQKNFLFDLVEPSAYDGVLALTGALGNHLGALGLGRWLAPFAARPLVTLGPDLPDHQGISVDGGAGMRAAVLHLIQEHGHRRIAFVRGPRHSAEAEERYLAYQYALEECGIEPDERLVLEGSWLRESGAAAVRELFDARRVNVELVGAIAAANDYMALGVLDELGARDIAVPESIAVTGFDDLDTLRGVVPALTTVRQPTDELGAAGFQRLIALLNRREEPLVTKLAAQLVERRSCGCVRARTARVSRSPNSARSFDAALVERRTLICAELARSARGALFGVGSGWENRLLSAFMSDVAARATSAFVGVVSDILVRLARSGEDPALLQPVLEQLRLSVNECTGGDADARLRSGDLFDAAREAMAEFLIRTETARRVAVLRQLRELSALAAFLLSGPPLERVQAELAQRFTALGVGALSLGLFTEPGRVSEQCLCLAAFNDGKRAPAPRTFRARDLCPPELFAQEKRPLLVQPLTFEGMPLGLVSCVLGDLENGVYEQLREALSAGLQGYRLQSAAHSGQIPSRKSVQS